MRVVIGLSPGSNSFLDAALAYASQGFLVFPCKEQSKEPATPRGFYNATTSPATIRRLFGSQRQYNVAIRCGQGPCFNFLFVMDLDGPEGEESWRALVTAHASPPATAEVKTANGRQLYFTANSPINCSTKRIAPGIDVRGDGGYVVAPPSVHPSGAVYRWLITGPVAPAPAWLIELAQKRPEPPIPISQRLLMQQAGRCRGSPNAY